MSCVIVVRRAQAADVAARADLIRQGFSSYYKDAFLLFFFQELTLQWCVLGGAVLFIFCGVPARGCAALLPVAALAVATAVYVAHRALADKHVQKLRQEMVGFVAEYRGPLVLDPERMAVRVLGKGEGEGVGEKQGGFAQLVGTVSVSRSWDHAPSGWMHALAVHPRWRRRGVGVALVRAAREASPSLGCVLAELQHAARALLHSDGWETRGWYHRPVCGRALSLQMAHFTTTLANESSA